MNKLNLLLLGLVAASVQAQDITSNQIFTLKESQNSSVLENKTESVLPHEAATMVAGKQAIIIDVREESEWNQQRIPGAIHIPLGQLNG